MARILYDKTNIEVPRQIDTQLDLGDGTDVDRQCRIRPNGTMCGPRVDHARYAGGALEQDCVYRRRIISTMVNVNNLALYIGRSNGGCALLSIGVIEPILRNLGTLRGILILVISKTGRSKRLGSYERTA